MFPGEGGDRQIMIGVALVNCAFLIPPTLPPCDFLTSTDLSKHEANWGLGLHIGACPLSLSLLLEPIYQAKPRLAFWRYVAQLTASTNTSEAISDHPITECCHHRTAAAWSDPRQNQHRNHPPEPSLICWRIESQVIKTVVVVDCCIMWWFVIQQKITNTGACRENISVRCVTLNPNQESLMQMN